MQGQKEEGKPGNPAGRGRKPGPSKGLGPEGSRRLTQDGVTEAGQLLTACLLSRVPQVYVQNVPLLAVNKISFALGAGECFGLLGSNGAGKTSIFKMLTGEEPITSGAAFVRGLSISSHLREVGGTREQGSTGKGWLCWQEGVGNGTWACDLRPGVRVVFGKPTNQVYM